jgi:hypothetical protein
VSTWVAATAHLPPRDIIAACAKRGVTVADYQLRRWAQYGLIPKAVRKGRGKKHGSLWSYPLDTSERPLLIARTLQEGDKSLSRAAVVLLGAGLVIRPDQLRNVLRHGEISPVGADCKRRRQPKHGARGGVGHLADAWRA